MGDHRAHSGDSHELFLRTHDVQASTIPESAVVGRAFVLFWPVGRAKWLGVPDTFTRVPAPNTG
jgi:signal peptidase I